ncbi:MAG: carboxylesterase/lipase family protein [Dehalococcoidia bacterium]
MGDNKQAIVNTRAGKVEGYYKEGLYVFKGIPYAAPPVGELRWLPPQPTKPWDGIRSAKQFGPIAPQNEMEGGVIPEAPPQTQDEDCLFLNIWTPGLDNAHRPVMVWIHGGAFTIGSSSEPMYKGSRLAARGDIVLVTINYRLGLLGFLNLKEVTKGRIPATGNEGLLDQLAALNWVKENIAAFGGDSDNITVFGESAGAMSIGCLMTMPKAKGYFHKGILESGVGSTAIPLDEAADTATQFLETTGIKGNDVQALRELTVKDLLEVEMKLRTAMAGPGEVARITVTSPVIDGELIPGVPNELASRGAAKEIPTIIGTNLEEWKLFGIMQPGINELDEAEVINRLSQFMSAGDAQKIVQTYREARQERGEPVTPFELLSVINTDLMFRIPALELVEAQRDNGQNVYNYLFTWKSPVMNGALGACHALEIGFVFGQYNDMFCGSGPDADKLSGCIQDAWTTFARTGDPSCESIGKWPVYGENRATMILGKDCHVEEAPYEQERQAWENVSYKSAMP